MTSTTPAARATEQRGDGAGEGHRDPGDLQLPAATAEEVRPDIAGLEPGLERKGECRDGRQDKTGGKDADEARGHLPPPQRVADEERHADRADEPDVHEPPADDHHEVAIGVGHGPAGSHGHQVGDVPDPEGEEALGGVAVRRRQAPPSDGEDALGQRGVDDHQGEWVGRIDLAGVVEQDRARLIGEVERGQVRRQGLAEDEPDLGWRLGKHRPGGGRARHQLGVRQHASAGERVDGRRRESRDASQQEGSRGGAEPRPPQPGHQVRRRASDSPSATSPATRPAPPRTSAIVAVVSRGRPGLGVTHDVGRCREDRPGTAPRQRRSRR